ncbi:hypothetical protein RclHR1_00660011 [Rhizophagus clarus]|nr:hypothetical protein RclHR1_00660011 [Rhizophagus clarus]
MTSQNYIQNSVSWEDYYDYEFTYQQSSNVKYHVTCKLLSHSLVANILNKEIYDKDFDVSDLKRKYTLTWDQRYNLELSLKKSLPSIQNQILKRESQGNVDMNASANQILTQATEIQPIQNYQSTQEQLRLFYQPPNDNNFYHVTYKMIVQENLISLEDECDYMFSDAKYYVTCKLLSHSLIVDILNKEIYGRDFDIEDLKRKYILTSNQKSNLKLYLQQQILPLYSHIHERPNSNEDISLGNAENNMMQAALMVDDQSYFDNVMPHSPNIDGSNDYTRQFVYPQQFFNNQMNNFDTSI